MRITQLTYSDLPQIAASVEVIVNTTPVGTYPNNMKSVIELADFPECEAVIDVIYNPFKTKLLLEAEKAGLRFSNGLPMLVAQATAAAGYFLGTPGAFQDENERIIKTLRNRMQNIAVIGMPGSGKSTIGRLIAEITGKRFVDMDAEIETRAGMTIPCLERQASARQRRRTFPVRHSTAPSDLVATAYAMLCKYAQLRCLQLLFSPSAMFLRYPG